MRCIFCYARAGLCGCVSDRRCLLRGLSPDQLTQMLFPTPEHLVSSLGRYFLQLGIPWAAQTQGRFSPSVSPARGSECRSHTPLHRWFSWGSLVSRDEGVFSAPPTRTRQEPQSSSSRPKLRPRRWWPGVLCPLLVSSSGQELGTVFWIWASSSVSEFRL